MGKWWIWKNVSPKTGTQRNKMQVWIMPAIISLQRYNLKRHNPALKLLILKAGILWPWFEFGRATRDQSSAAGRASCRWCRTSRPKHSTVKAGREEEENKARRSRGGWPQGPSEQLGDSGAAKGERRDAPERWAPVQIAHRSSEANKLWFPDLMVSSCRSALGLHSVSLLVVCVTESPSVATVFKYGIFIYFESLESCHVSVVVNDFFWR